MNNRTLLTKAAVDTSALTNGGKLNPEQSNQFITFMRDYSAFLSRVDMVTMNAPQRQLEYLDVNKRAMRTQLENQNNVPVGEIETKKRMLTAKGVVMPYDITFQFMKENIEKVDVNTTLARMFAQQFANDTVDLAFNGDEASSGASDSDFLKINNGWIKILSSDSGTHKHDSTTAEPSNGDKDMITIFDKILGEMPSQYFQMYQQEDKSQLKIFVSHAENRRYKNQLVERNTVLGDSMLINGANVNYDGFEIVPVGFIPDGIRILSAYKNFAYGIYGQSIQVYHEVKPRYTRHEYTLLADFDFEMHNPDAVVLSKKGLS
ncbi:hypothetical protein [Eubacterium sp.]|uniref:hypothetical protein n=1 Tax=Eubacterium sp. TaxID=142586 RepID=UPI002FCB9E9E